MPLFSCGINHRETPLSVRERLAFNAEQTPALLKDLCRLEAVNEAVLLSTCNRTEIYIAGEHPRAVQEWFKTQAADCYTHEDFAAVQHLLRVSSGIDSMALGEPQIFGQLKQAYRTACETGAAGPRLQHLFPTIFAASKQIRQETQIGAHSISMAYATVQLAKRIFTHLPNCCVLLIGAGEMMELMLTYWKTQGVRRFILANRTIDKAQRFAQFESCSAIRIGDIPAYLNQVDIVITATASQLPIIGKGLVERTLKLQKRRPILMIDLAVPRDIEPEVGELTDVYLYNIDDLQTILEANLKNRREAALQAEALIEIQAAHYMRQCHILNIRDIITGFREQAERHRDQTVEKALAELQQGRDPALVVAQLAHQLTNKILHHPTMKLREAAYHQQTDLLLSAKKLLTTEDIQ